MKLLILLALVACVCAFEDDNVDKDIYRSWKKNVAKYNKKFMTPEKAKESFKNFAQSHIQVVRHNKLYEEGKVSFQMETNEFSDRTQEEKQKSLGYKPEELVQDKSPKRSLSTVWNSPNGLKLTQYDADATIPAKVDWSSYACTVLDQKQCGSCYSFSSAKALEMNLRIQFGLPCSNISTQYIVDCSKGYKNYGCNGGSAFGVYDFLRSRPTPKCLVPESAYPYKGVDQTVSNTTCNNLCSNAVLNYTVDSYYMAKQGDIKAAKSLMAKGPTVCVLHVDSYFNQYKSGLFSHPSYSPTNATMAANHAVVCVGYEDVNGITYIKVLNSWSRSWGETGYIRVRADHIHMPDLHVLPVVRKL
jgi:C1A family cysteine protease